MLTTRTYALGTSLTTSLPWGINVTARALCPDGKVRQVKRIAPCADTAFSISASITYRGRTVAGFLTVETIQGLSVESPDDLAVVKFVAVSYRKNANLFPNEGKAFRTTPTLKGVSPCQP